MYFNYYCKQPKEKHNSINKEHSSQPVNKMSQENKDEQAKKKNANQNNNQNDEPEMSLYLCTAYVLTF